MISCEKLNRKKFLRKKPKKIHFKNELLILFKINN